MDGRDPEQLPRPFTVGYDTDAEKYYIFAPEGCVLVDGKAATINGVDSSGNVTLDFGQPPNYLWAHVKKASSGDGYEVFFDGEQTMAGAKWDFRVARFGETDDDGNQYDIATGVVNLGSSSEVNVDEKSIDWTVEEHEGEGNGVAAEGEDEEESKALEIKGWKDQASSGITLVDAMGLNKKQDEGGGGGGGGVSAGGSSSSDDGRSKQVLVRNGPDGSLEYMPLGKVKGDGEDEDEDEEADDPCSHDIYGEGGGVSPDGSSKGGSGGVDPSSAGGAHGGGEASSAGEGGAAGCC